MKIFFRKSLITTCISLLFCFTMTSCSKKTPNTATNCNSSKISVAVSIVPEETFVKAVGKDLVDVTTLIPSGQSPETFQPTPDLLEKFSKSQLYFSIGVPTEQTSILPKAKDLNPNVKIIGLDKQVRNVYPDLDISNGMRDPHIWLSPKRVKLMITSIKDELCKLDSSNKDFYEKNAKEYIDSLDKIDKEIASSLKNCKNKSVIVYHPAFGYFCDDYNIKMISLEKEGKESTIKNLQDTIKYAQKNNIKIVFHQAEVDSKQAKTFADEIDGNTKLIEPLSPNYMENLQIISDTFKESFN